MRASPLSLRSCSQTFLNLASQLSHNLPSTDLLRSSRVCLYNQSPDQNTTGREIDQVQQLTFHTEIQLLTCNSPSASTGPQRCHQKGDRSITQSSRNLQHVSLDLPLVHLRMILMGFLVLIQTKLLSELRFQHIPRLSRLRLLLRRHLALWVVVVALLDL